MIPPLEAVTVPAGTVAPLGLVGGWCLLRGWALRGTGGVAWAASIADGQDPTTAQSVVPLIRPAGEGDIRFLPGAGIPCESGVLLTVEAGAVEGTIFVTTSEHADEDELGRQPAQALLL